MKIKQLWSLTGILFFLTSSVLAIDQAQLQLFQSLSPEDQAKAMQQFQQKETLQAEPSNNDNDKKSSKLANLNKVNSEEVKPSTIEAIYQKKLKKLYYYNYTFKQFDLYLKKEAKAADKQEEVSDTKTIDTSKSTSKDFLQRQQEQDNQLGTMVENQKMLTEEAFKLPEEITDSIQQFGYNMFENATDTTFTQSNVPVGKDYVLGPGDSIVIYIWGKLEEQFEKEIDNEGKITLPKVGYIVLTNKTIQEAETLIQKELSKYYVNFNVKLTIGKLRSIRVYILGDVISPGAYNLPSLATFFYGVMQAGGPTKLGTLRNIKLVRNKKTYRIIDLYDYLIKGDNSQDPKLQANDIIFIPSIGNTAFIHGAVKKPGIYEIKQNESIAELINLAGGMTGLSSYKNIQIERVENNNYQVLEDFSFDSFHSLSKKLAKVNINDTDIINIFPVPDTVRNYVTIAGSINQPGNYELKKELTLAQLIDSAAGLKSDAYKKRLDIYRYTNKGKREIIAINLNKKEEKNFLLQEWDYIKIYSSVDILGNSIVSIEGAIEQPGDYNILHNMRISDLVFTAKLKPFARMEKAELFRRIPGEATKIITIDLQEILDSPGSDIDLLLQTGDNLFIKQESRYTQVKRIMLTGEVRYPGSYIAREGEKLSSIIDRAGGFTNKAFLKGIVFKRKSIKTQEDNAQNRILNQERKRIIYDQARFSNLDVELYERIMKSREAALGLIDEKMDTSRGRLVLGIIDFKNFENSEADVVIEEGDALYVPQIPTAIQVVGGIKYPTAVKYIIAKDTLFYINQAGGFSEYADKTNIYILKANGSISLNTKKVEEGDTIYVPETIIVPTNWVDLISKVVNILYQTALTWKVFFQ